MEDQQLLDALTRLRLELLQKKLRLLRKETDKQQRFKELGHALNILEFERMTRNRVLGMDEDDYTFDTKGKTPHTPGGTFTAEDKTNSSGKDSVELRIIQQLLSKEHLLSPREELTKREFAVQTEDEIEEPVYGPLFSDIIYAPIPAWRTVGGAPRLKMVGLAVRFLIRFRKVLEGYLPTKDGKLKKDLVFEQTEQQIAETLLKRPELQEWLERMMDVVEQNVEFMGKKGTSKKLTELDLFKLASRIEEAVIIFVRMDLSFFEKSQLRFMLSVITAENEFPSGYLSNYEANLLSQSSKQGQQRTSVPVRISLFLNLLIVRVFIKLILLRIANHDTSIDLRSRPEAKLLFQRNTKMVAALLYRLLRDVWSLKDYQTAPMSDDILKSIAEADPEEDVKPFRDDQLKSVVKKLGEQFPIWASNLQTWSLKFIQDLTDYFQ